MASTIIIKNGTGSQSPSSLIQGELGINVSNGKLFFGTSGSSNSVSSSFAFTNISASGTISANDYTLDGVALTTTFTELNYLDGLTSGEATQIKNIGGNAISAAEWGYVAGGQAHGTSNSPTFANLGLSTHHETGQIRLAAAAAASKPHLRVIFEAENYTPFITLGDRDGNIINFFNQEGDTSFSINQNGLFSGQAATVATIAGLAPNTATTQATQAAITRCANLATVGTIVTGVWQGTAVASAYLDADTAHLTTDQTFSGRKTFSAPITASIISASGTITGNSIVGTVGTATQGTINHDSLAGFVANEHIDHSGVSITAGAGLTGGGTIAATRDIAVGAGTGVTVNANDVAIGQDVATTANVLFGNITASNNISASGNIVASGTVVGSNTIRVANTKRFQGAQISTTNAGDWLHSDNEGEQKDDNYDNTIGTTGITSGTTTITTNIAARGSKYIVPTATTASKWTGYITHTLNLDLSLGLWKVTPVDNNASALTLHEITGEITLEGKGNNKMRTFSVDVHPDSGSLSPGDLIVPLIKRESGTSSGVAHFNSSLLFYMEV